MNNIKIVNLNTINDVKKTKGVTWKIKMYNLQEFIMSLLRIVNIIIMTLDCIKEQILGNILTSPRPVARSMPVPVVDKNSFY